MLVNGSITDNFVGRSRMRDITDCAFIGGCSGNTQGVASLVIGMKAEDAVAKIKGIKCGMKSTSCPDQLALALEEALEA